MQLGLEEGIRLENNGSVKILMIPHEYWGSEVLNYLNNTLMFITSPVSVFKYHNIFKLISVYSTI